MGKIIKFSDCKAPKKEINPFNCMHLEEIDKCRDLLNIQGGLLDTAAFYAEEYLRNASIDPSEFRLSQESAEEYMALNFLELISGKEDVSIDFEYSDGDTEYTMEVAITCEDRENFQLDGVLYREGANGSEFYDDVLEDWFSCPV